MTGPQPKSSGDRRASPVQADMFGRAEAAARVVGIRSQTQFGDFRRRFARNHLAVIGLAMVTGLVLVALLAPVLVDPSAPDLSDGRPEQGPSSEHWFGTDHLGQDILSRVIYGTRIAVTVGGASIALGLMLGVALGALAGYFGRRWDSVIMRVADVFFAFPIMIGAIVLILVVGKGVVSLVLSIALFSWAVPARLLRSSILSIRESDYVRAARALGASPWRTLTRHVLPNALVPVLVFAAASVGGAVVVAASLSYLGAGVEENAAEWGEMIRAAVREDVTQGWLFPTLAVVYTVLGFSLVGDGLRDALDPTLR